ncbi:MULTISPECIES: L,D-transpeptidase [unclassified Romboutsia]|uniref:L,D-transpeptidase n=1 Tax=unclassified Romboutsia TaxID=2626894 RepID=UPI0008208760|nr:MULTISPECIES: L,D-transpeptidase [unclassified Romboutsia]SCI43576.1 L%2CD-transpeptidase catalytic domain [uncultured Clostridium sp.]
MLSKKENMLEVDHSRISNHYKNKDSIKYNRILNYNKFNINMTEFVNDNKIKSLTNYLLVTSIKERMTYVYEREDDVWELLYKWSCTVGKPSTPTIKGVFSIGVKYDAITSEGSRVFVKYAVNIIGEYYYHSILYDINTGEIYDDRLGVAISHGCIRLDTNNAKWIYDNIPIDTTVVIN